MRKLARLIVLSLLVVMLGSLSSLAQQLLISTDPTTFQSIPPSYLLVIQVGGTNSRLRAYMDDNELPTVVAAWNILDSNWSVATGPGAHALKVMDITDNSIFSNIVTLMVGQAPNVQVCAGGLLPQDADIATIAQYEHTYNVLNCRYMEPPRCASDHVPTSALDCTE